MDTQRSKKTVPFCISYFTLKDAQITLSELFLSVKLGSNIYLALLLCWIRDNIYTGHMVNISRWLFFFFRKGVLTCSFISAPTAPSLSPAPLRARPRLRLECHPVALFPQGFGAGFIGEARFYCQGKGSTWDSAQKCQLRFQACHLDP